MGVGSGKATRSLICPWALLNQADPRYLPRNRRSSPMIEFRSRLKMTAGCAGLKKGFARGRIMRRPSIGSPCHAPANILSHSREPREPLQ